mgnify:CR=1 FL=1
MLIPDQGGGHLQEFGVLYYVRRLRGGFERPCHLKLPWGSPCLLNYQSFHSGEEIKEKECDKEISF